MVEKKLINHFSHHHQLKLYKGVDYYQYKKSPWSSTACHLCRKVDTFSEVHKISGKEISPIYGCKECGFFVHKSCAELPLELSHPFHPQHVLCLQEIAAVQKPSDDDDWKLQCYACGIDTTSNYIYHCSHCKFTLDFSCIQLKPSNKYEAQTAQNSHHHPLFVCNKVNTSSYDDYDFKLPCSFCHSLFSPMQKICVCVHCKNLLHESCALPPEIIHPFRLEHPLVILRKEFKCNACSRTRSAAFHCSRCQFSLDLDCATLLPTTRNSESDDHSHSSHSHPLIQCDNIKKTKFYCSGCGSSISDSNSIFVCLQCGILLDKSCTELPQEITHSFHPLHHLKLIENPKSVGRSFYYQRDLRCRACLATIDYFFYYACQECKFYLHPPCATITECKFYLHPPCATITAQVVKSKAHYHALAFLSTKPQDLSFISRKTCIELCEKNYFHCVQCEFGIHLNCYPFLPTRIKHDCHCDPLVLVKSRIKDIPDEDSDEEFYCDACEKLRDLDDPTYYCKDCHFVAHTHCVISEILHCIERESAPSEWTESINEFHPPPFLIELSESTSERLPPEVPFPFDQLPAAPISELAESPFKIFQQVAATELLPEALSEFLQSNDPSETFEVQPKPFLRNTFSFMKSRIQGLALVIPKWIGFLALGNWLANIVTKLIKE